MPAYSKWLMHTFPPSVTFSLTAAQRWRAAIVKRGLQLLPLLIRLQQGAFQKCSRSCNVEMMRTVRSDWWRPPWSLWLSWRQILAAKKAHAPDCMPLLMGKPFSAESCGKASTLPVQSQSGEQHILWRAFSVSVKGICYAGFTEWVRFRPMRATERAARFLWKQ